jgi:hypothetical protein
VSLVPHEYTTRLNISLSFVDRDMAMRFHWGLGIGHTYADMSSSHSKKLYLHAVGSSGEHAMGNSVTKSRVGDICTSGSFVDEESEKDDSGDDSDSGWDDIGDGVPGADQDSESESETLKRAMYESGSEDGDFDF